MYIFQPPKQGSKNSCISGKSFQLSVNILHNYDVRENIFYPALSNTVVKL